MNVRIHKNDSPKFPPACVRCGETPTTSIKVGGDALGWWSVMRVGRLWGSLTGRSFDVPACEVCARAIKWDRFKRKAAELVMITLGVFVGMWVFSDWEGIPKKIAVVALGLVIALPYYAFDYFYPAAVTVTVTEESVTFHFADDDYAQDFADRNPTL